MENKLKDHNYDFKQFVNIIQNLDNKYRNTAKSEKVNSKIKYINFRTKSINVSFDKFFSKSAQISNKKTEIFKRLGTFELKDIAEEIENNSQKS